jgi:hypothetical protein
MMWDAVKFKPKATLKGHEDGIWSLMYDTQGK